MTEINLLPWREKKREQEKKFFTTMLLSSVVVSAFVVFLVYSYANHLISNQTERNKILKDQINVLNEEIKEIKALKQVRESLISRMAIVQNLQSTRTLMVHLFDELIKIMPSGAYVYKLDRKKDLITLSGYAESNTNISVLMTNIENNAWMQTPILMEIKKLDDSKQAANNDFTLTFTLQPKNQAG